MTHSVRPSAATRTSPARRDVPWVGRRASSGAGASDSLLLGLLLLLHEGLELERVRAGAEGAGVRR